MKRWMIVLLAVCLLWAFAGCHKETVVETEPTQPSTEPYTEPVLPKVQVEICLPEKTAQWEACANGLQERLQQQGYAAKMHYAGGSAQEQAKLLRTLIQQGAELLVVAPVDSHSLGQELESAASAGVKVVTLDRQVLHAQGICAAVTFDYVSMGVSMGYQIAEAKKLSTAKEENRSHTIEFLMGSADDRNAVLIHQGVMAVLQPYLDSGVLVCKTGRVSLEDAYVQRWDADEAQTKFSLYLQDYALSAPEVVCTAPEIVCTASDALAAGCIAALTEAGCTSENWPVITGIGGDKDAIRNILEGKQSHTVYRDAAMLYDTCCEIVHSLLEGKPLPKQDNAAADGTTEVPTYVCPGVQVDGVKGIGKLLENGVSAKDLSLTKGDLAKINAPEETQPPETTAPTEPETTEPETTETTPAAS